MICHISSPDCWYPVTRPVYDSFDNSNKKGGDDMDDFIEEQLEDRLWLEGLDEIMDEQTLDAGEAELER